MQGKKPFYNNRKLQGQRPLNDRQTTKWGGYHDLGSRKVELWLRFGWPGARRYAIGWRTRALERDGTQRLSRLSRLF